MGLSDSMKLTYYKMDLRTFIKPGLHEIKGKNIVEYVV